MSHIYRGDRVTSRVSCRERPPHAWAREACLRYIEDIESCLIYSSALHSGNRIQLAPRYPVMSHVYKESCLSCHVSCIHRVMSPTLSSQYTLAPPPMIFLSLHHSIATTLYNTYYLTTLFTTRLRTRTILCYKTPSHAPPATLLPHAPPATLLPHAM
jgi:hypothetical protein